MVERDVADHYGRGDLATTLRRALVAAGLGDGALTPRDLAPVDEFHMRGRAATAELIAAMGLEPENHLLDIGCGVGGATRGVADEIGCVATGVDLVHEYVAVARELTARCGLNDRVHYEQGSALDLPFADETFDAALTQHACMNIANKAQVYAEARRVLRPGAPFGVYDVMQGPGGDSLHPVPWATEPAISFLATPDDVCAWLAAAGFEVESAIDRSAECLAWIEGVRARAGGERPALGIHLLLGAEFPLMMANMVRSLSEQRICGVQIIARAV